MPQDPIENAEMEELDREIKAQKKLTRTLVEEQQPVSTLYTWTAPERDYNPKTKRWYVAMAGIALIFIVLAALTKNYLLIFTIIALIVVMYTINTIPPHDVKHQITNKGIYSFSTIFLWKNILAFWVTTRGTRSFLHLEYRGKANDADFKTMVILVGSGNLVKIVTYLVAHVDYLGEEEIGSSALSEWTHGKYIPLLDIVGDNDITTKDPNDAPYILRANRSNKK